MKDTHSVPIRSPLTPKDEEGHSASIAAIQFVLNQEDGCGLDFLRCWNEGNFDAIRREWPEAPEAVFIGADPSHPLTVISDSAPTELIRTPLTNTIGNGHLAAKGVDVGVNSVDADRFKVDERGIHSAYKGVDVELPPLPAPTAEAWGNSQDPRFDAYTAQQMREYALQVAGLASSHPKEQAETFGLPRMHKALAQEQIDMPDGLNRAEMKAFISDVAGSHPKEQTCEQRGYVPLSDDGKSVFIEGLGEVQLVAGSHPKEQAEPVAWVIVLPDGEPEMSSLYTDHGEAQDYIENQAIKGCTLRGFALVDIDRTATRASSHPIQPAPAIPAQIVRAFGQVLAMLEATKPSPPNAPVALSAIMEEGYAAYSELRNMYLRAPEHPAISDIRAQALEEAAKICDAYAVKWCASHVISRAHAAAAINLADKIRALLGQITPKAEQPESERNV